MSYGTDKNNTQALRLKLARHYLGIILNIYYSVDKTNNK